MAVAWLPVLNMKTSVIDRAAGESKAGVLAGMQFLP
jgi:hypothetical protein